MSAPEDSTAHLLGYRIEREAPAVDRWRVLAPDDPGVLAVFDGLPAAERFVVLRELRGLDLRPRHPAY